MNASRLAPWVLCLTFGTGAAASSSSPQHLLQSASGQFSVLPGTSAEPSVSSAFLSGSDLLRLEPTLLTVSSERLRQHLTRELQDSSPWEGRILFALHGTQSFQAPVEMVAQWQGNGWQYQVSLPEYMARDRFVRALVEVNLMEMANRTSRGRAAEIPAWLTEGLTAQLLASRSIEIILPPPQMDLRSLKITPWMVEEVKYQPLALAHAQMQTNTPLTIEQLSWPEPDALEGRKGVAYRHCSHLLVIRLLQLPNGPAQLNHFIRNLGRHYNWQVAFLASYPDAFPSLLDLEKWWALQVAHFTGRELRSTYNYLDSVTRLNEAVRFPVEVRLATNDLPMHGDIPLQTIIEAWDGNRQLRALEHTCAELNLLRSRVAPEVIPLLDDYRLALERYLRNRNRTGIYLPKGTNRQASLIRLIRDTVKRLDQLDAELAALLPEPAPEPAFADSPR